MSRVIDEHRLYLDDRHRIDAFARALQAVVRPGDRVVDLGSGTGILGLLAARAGAGTVYAIEATGIIGLAAQIGAANQYRDRVVYLRGHSTMVRLPEPADLIVTDEIGRFGFEGGVLQYFSDARRRLLKPGARFMPEAIRLHLAAVESERLYDRIDFWNSKPAEFDFGCVRGLAANTAYPARLHETNLLGAPATALRLDLSCAEPERLVLDQVLSIARSGVLHGLGGWFSAELGAGVSMSNSPLDPARIRRRQVFLPLERPVHVGPGDTVHARVQILPETFVVSWDARVSTAGAEQIFRHSTLRGMLLTAEDFERTRPSFRPVLTPLGAARRSILELADGGRTLAEIEDEVFRRHPALFASREQATVFVSEVVTRYAEPPADDDGVVA